MAKFSLAGTLQDTLSTWVILLRSLSFVDNFRGYEWEGEIAAGKEKPITHDLRVVPKRFIVLSGEPALLKEGAENATADFFFLKNVGTTSTFIGKVLILP